MYKLINGDSFKILKQMEEESVDFIFADPPYFLSSGGITCKSGKVASVDKADWDFSKTLKDKYEFNVLWLKECKRILKPNGSIMISGTFHNIFSIGMALEELEYKILNNITWKKTNPPPNISCRYFTHSTENVLWARKTKNNNHLFNYEDMKKENFGKQMQDVWEIPSASKSEKNFGYHPTQKPIKLLNRIILSATKENDVVLDPFCGSGTTGVAAVKYGRKFIGIDNEPKYLEIAEKRIKEVIVIDK